MTIIRREKPVPTALPNARLYIDDVQELVRVLTEAGNEHPVQPGKKGTEVLFQVGDQLCDQIEDLPKCENSRNFELLFSCEQRGYNVRLGISWIVCQWTSTGLTKDESWRLFHKIEAVFNARKIYRLIPEKTSPVLFVLTILVPSLVLLIPEQTVGKLAAAPQEVRGLWIGSIIVALLVFLGFFFNAFGGSGVILRYSWDEHTRRRDNFWRIVPSLISGVLGLVVGIALTYLKHKYWP